MMKKEDKNAVSPIVATVLLIMLVVILAIIILSWSVGWFKESIIKQVGDKESRINEFCNDIDMQKILEDDGSFGFNNVGNVPIYAVNLKLSSAGSSQTIKLEKEDGGRVNPGVSTIFSGYNYNSYEEVNIIPILIGTSKKGGLKEYECPESYALTI